MGATRPMPTTAVEGLTQGERLLLWSFRAWVSGPGHRPMVLREFGRLFPADEAGPAIRALEKSVAAIAGHARREIQHHPVCAQQVAPDEQAVLALFAALQEERVDIAIRHAAWLVRPSGVTPVVTAAAALAFAMIENDLVLPYRPIPQAVAGGQPAALELRP